MNKYQKNTAIIVIIAFIGIVTACSSNLTAETVGQVTTMTLDRDRKTTKRKTSSGKTKTKTKVEVETEVEYSYTVEGKVYSGYSEKDGDVQRDFGVGSNVTVCYNPKNPEESDVFPSGSKCN